jgi:hypothetical protein
MADIFIFLPAADSASSFVAARRLRISDASLFQTRKLSFASA